MYMDMCCCGVPTLLLIGNLDLRETHVVKACRRTSRRSNPPLTDAPPTAAHCRQEGCVQRDRGRQRTSERSGAARCGVGPWRESSREARAVGARGWGPAGRGIRGSLPQRVWGVERTIDCAARWL